VSRAQELADALEEELRQLGTPERAMQEQAYLKSSFEFLGVSVPAGRKATKSFLYTHGELAERELLLATVEALWSRPVFERRRAAVELLQLRRSVLRVEDLGLVERLVHESYTWALVDELAADVAGGLVADHFEDPVVHATLDAWAKDGDFWLRRSALLAHLVVLKHGRGFESFARYADAMLDEQEFFIRKAIGWVLREEGRRRPDLVAAWLLPRADRASGVTVTEAVKYLAPQQADAIKAARRTRARR
jgi:3-methyladenine DNA glycosylase AlkD